MTDIATSDDIAAIACPDCGSTDWHRWEGGDYTERHFYDSATDTHDWDKQETNVMSSEPWECANGHRATDDIEERLADA